MKRVLPLVLAGWTIGALFSLPAHADVAVGAVERTVDEAMAEGPYTFCKKPVAPLFERQRALCSLSDVEGCEGFAEACAKADPLADRDEDRKDEPRSSIFSALAPIARALLYVLVLAIVLAMLVPIVRAILRARRNKKLADKAPEASAAAAVPIAAEPATVEEISDADAALRLAEEHRLRGDNARALGLYLAASLSALDRRGAIRIAKHRTNGEYVRSCTDELAKPPLREIVREVDKVHFGKALPTEEAVSQVAARATALVRSAATIALVTLAILACGCGGHRGRSYDDPAGDELPLEVLRRNGFDVAPLGQSLASVATSEHDDSPPEGERNKAPEVIVVDVDRVPLDEDETQAHLMRWVEEGGVLVLFGSVSGWPRDLNALPDTAGTREIVLDEWDFRIPDDEDEDWDDRDLEEVKVREIRGRIAEPRAVNWRGARALARAGTADYVVKRQVGKGIVIGVAGSDLFTNVGMLPKHNAAILVGIVRVAAQDARQLHPESVIRSILPSGSAGDGTPGGRGAGEGVRVRHAKREDAIPPPSTPFAALLAAGLGKGTWHALAAAILLFLAFGIRHARPKPREPRARRAFAEHVEATGAFWGRANALPHALAAYGRFVEMRLRERIPRGADPAAFLANRAKVDPEHAARLYERATQAKDDDDLRGDELETIRELRVLLVKALEAS